jgi:hypothetical protein
MMRIQPAKLTVADIKEYDLYRGTTNKKKDRLIFAPYCSVQSLINSSKDNLMQIGYYYSNTMGWRCDVYVWGDHVLLTGYGYPKGLNIRVLTYSTCKRIVNKYKR